MRPGYLSTANIIVALAGFLMLVFLVIDVRKAWQMDADKYRSASFLQIIIFQLAACLLTLSRKLRRSVLFTLILVVIYCFFIFKEAIYHFFTSYSRDTLPSSWPYYHSTSDLYILVYAAVYLAICYFIAAKPSSARRR